MLSDQYVERIQNVFSNSPLANNEEFYAAQIIDENTEYKTSNETTSNIMIIFLGMFFGAIIGIFFVLLVNAIKTRS